MNYPASLGRIVLFIVGALIVASCATANEASEIILVDTETTQVQVEDASQSDETTSPEAPAAEVMDGCSISTTIDVPGATVVNAEVFAAFASNERSKTIWTVAAAHNNTTITTFDKELNAAETFVVEGAGSFVAVGPDVAYVAFNSGELIAVDGDGNKTQIWEPHGNTRPFDRTDSARIYVDPVGPKRLIIDAEDDRYFHEITDYAIVAAPMGGRGGRSGLDHVVMPRGLDGNLVVDIFDYDGYHDPTDKAEPEAHLEMYVGGPRPEDGQTDWMGLPGYLPILLTDINQTVVFYTTSLDPMFSVTSDQLQPFSKLIPPDETYALRVVNSTDALSFISRRIRGFDELDPEESKTVIYAIDGDQQQPFAAVEIPFAYVATALTLDDGIIISSDDRNLPMQLLEITCRP